MELFTDLMELLAVLTELFVSLDGIIHQNNSNSKIPFQIKFKYVICCGDVTRIDEIIHQN